MSRGYLIYAVDEPYISKAQTLKKSIEHHTNDDVTIISDNFPYEKTKPLVWDGKVQPTNNLLDYWQLYWATPYNETIVLDADMLFLNDYSYWWDYLSKFDLLFPDTIINYKQETIKHEQYDKILTEHNIRPAYEKMFYFKKGDNALEFFNMLQIIISNFIKFSFEYYPSVRPKECIARYFMPACIASLGIEDIVYDKNNILKYVDMKISCLNAPVKKWNEDLYYWGDMTNFYIENFNQYYPLHYRNAEIHTL
tara:strand:- start:706 stop:1461 length:756 start_codon:yes stop_codon:yes gene_type:complete